MRLILLALALLAIPSMSAVSAATVAAGHPDARPFEQDADAMAQVDAALVRVQGSDKHLLLVMGANWCHDSRGLSGWLAEPRFAEMLQARYEVIYVDVCHPQRGDGCNIDIAQRFGIQSIKGTPTVLVISSQGLLLNRKSAPKWRNAASRSEEEIYAYFDEFVPES